MTWSPRPVSARELGSLGTGGCWLGSATAHSTQGPGCTRPSRTGHRGRGAPGPGSACRSALVSSSDTTIAISSRRSVAPHRCKVAMVKSRAARTDPASVPGVQVATFGRHIPDRGPGSGDRGQFPLALAAISPTGARQPRALPLALLPARRNGCAVMAVQSAGGQCGLGQGGAVVVEQVLLDDLAVLPPCRRRAQDVEGLSGGLNGRSVRLLEGL